MFHRRIIAGSTGEVDWVRVTKADGSIVASSGVSGVTCLYQEVGGDLVTGNGAAITTSVPTGYTFGWQYGSNELGSARKLLTSFRFTETGYGTVKLPPFILEVVEDLA